MPNKNYIKGRKKEYSIVHKLKKKGFDIVQRTAGSRSPVDIIAIHRKKKIILLVQSKPKGYHSQEYAQYYWLNDKFKVSFFIE